MSNIYRDPSISQMARALEEEKTKNVILEEQNEQLRSLLKKELQAEPEPSKPRAPWFRRLSCRLLGSHTPQVEVYIPGVLDVISNTYVEGNSYQLTRQEFQRHCSVICEHCGLIIQECYQPTPPMALGMYAEIIQMVNKAYNQFLEQYSIAVR